MTEKLEKLSSGRGTLPTLLTPTLPTHYQHYFSFIFFRYKLASTGIKSFIFKIILLKISH